MAERVNHSDCCCCQAVSMANFAGISLNEAQILAYKEEQKLIYQHAVEYLRNNSSIPSDQKILDSFLTPEQSATFQRAFPNIFH